MGIRVYEKGSDVDLENRNMSRLTAATIAAGMAIAVLATNPITVEIPGQAECDPNVKGWEIIEEKPSPFPGEDHVNIAIMALVPLCSDHK